LPGAILFSASGALFPSQDSKLGFSPFLEGQRYQISDSGPALEGQRIVAGGKREARGPRSTDNARRAPAGRRKNILISSQCVRLTSAINSLTKWCFNLTETARWLGLDRQGIRVTGF
jgi:hypothetical protein